MLVWKVESTCTCCDLTRGLARNLLPAAPSGTSLVRDRGICVGLGG